MKTPTYMRVGMVDGLPKKVKMFKQRWLMSYERKYVLETKGGILTQIF